MINFNLKFDTTGNGPAPTKAQKDAIKLAAEQWGRQFANEATIELNVSSSILGSRLMQAGPALTSEPKPGFGEVEVARNKILFGKDLNGSEVDAFVEIDWSNNWELDFDETPNQSEDEFDFYSAFYHELSHALGFLSSLDGFGRDAFQSFVGTGSWVAFDEFITDAQGNPIIDSNGDLDNARFNELVKGGSSQDNRSGLFFSGPNAKAANGGKGIGLYTPDQLLAESPSHLDLDNSSLSETLMLPAREPGAAPRTLDKIEKAIFEDLGYSFDQSTGPSPKGDTPVLADKNTSIKLDSFGDGNTIAFTLDQIGVDEVSELMVFKVDDALGQNKQEIASFSILKDGQLPSAYAPSLLVENQKISPGDRLQFELVEKGTNRVATTTANALKSNETVALDFGEETVLTLQSAQDSSKTNLLLDDAEALDLRGQSDLVKLEFSVFREAAFNNTIGFYATETAEGRVRDPLTGESLNPGDTGYKEAALSKQIDTRLTGENGSVSTFTAEIQGADFLGAFLIADGTDPMAGDLYFSHLGANSNGNDHTKLLGNNTFGFEDMPGLGDRDFNDVVVAFEVV